MVVINRKRIRCVVVAVPAAADVWASRGALAHGLVPGADPYVAQLIKRLQDEVRHERRALARVQRVKRTTTNRLLTSTSPVVPPQVEPREVSNDLEIPWFDMPAEDDPLVEGHDALPDFSGDPNDDPAPAW
jgi:hypothetical protein